MLLKILVCDSEKSELQSLKILKYKVAQRKLEGQRRGPSGFKNISTVYYLFYYLYFYQTSIPCNQLA